MGRRKKATKVVTKKRKMEVPKVFKCLFCNHQDSVDCRMDKAAMQGFLKCRMCGAAFESSITTLSQPIDVFCDWLDETNEKQKRESER